jgi:hypothetical protein
VEPEELQIELAGEHGGVTTLHVSEIVVAGHGEARQGAQRPCEVKADLVHVKGRRKRQGEVGHVGHDGVLVGGEEDGQMSALTLTTAVASERNRQRASRWSCWQGESGVDAVEEANDAGGALRRRSVLLALLLR